MCAPRIDRWPRLGERWAPPGAPCAEASGWTNCGPTSGIPAGPYSLKDKSALDRQIGIYEVCGPVRFDLADPASLPGVICTSTALSERPTRLYRNRGQFAFQEIESGLPEEDGGQPFMAFKLVVADLNHDHKSDIAILPRSNTPKVFKAHIKAQETQKPPPDLASLALGPLLRVFAGNGDGTFHEVTDEWGFRLAGPQFFPSQIAASDLNGDGFVDLCVGKKERFDDSGAEHVACFLSHGATSWQFDDDPFQGKAVGHPWAYYFHDGNGDGKIDLLIANHVAWFHGSNGMSITSRLLIQASTPLS